MLVVVMMLLLLLLMVVPREVRLRPADLRTKGRSGLMVIVLRTVRVGRDGRVLRE